MNSQAGQDRPTEHVQLDSHLNLMENRLTDAMNEKDSIAAQMTKLDKRIREIDGVITSCRAAISAVQTKAVPSPVDDPEYPRG